MDLSERVKALRNVAVKIALKNPLIKLDKNLIKGFGEKKTIAFECQVMGINLIPSLDANMKESWHNNCYWGLKFIQEDEVDHLAKVARFFGETYEMKFFAKEIKEGNYNNKEALEFLANNMKGSIEDLIIK
jgi:hypothetical protein|tara:strand:+ start:846 stop:1238 length:393 start_codon:yes stop_codon:yes gene_type:complete